MSSLLDTLITRSDQHPLSTCLDKLRIVRVFPPPDGPPKFACPSNESTEKPLLLPKHFSSPNTQLELVTRLPSVMKNPVRSPPSNSKLDTGYNMNPFNVSLWCEGTSHRFTTTGKR
ncbi:uncharacterized protein N7503_005984 [Penicillium pulvis]|uniref:uncharacterized protein n=1 Tax=Penicillium pulvis TaxID=1562058 RepID=UPI002548408A|nr:uncharacterized protein N7503_005984 [Penicillium pulvis]KAJ5803534.1 hypothetical protein N7503_005984 [Penicillium pulvis]